MNPIDIESYAGTSGVTLQCYPGDPVTTVVMKNTNNYAVNVDFTNGSIPSRILLPENETEKFLFVQVKCSPTLVVITKVTKA